MRKFTEIFRKMQPETRGKSVYGRLAGGRILAVMLAMGLLLQTVDLRNVKAAEETETAGTEQAGEDASGTEEEIPLPQQRIGSNWEKAAGRAAELGYTYLAMENHRAAFYINEDGNVGIQDKASGKWLTSVPTEEGREADELAKAVNKMNLGSDYQVVFVDQNGATTVKNTLAGAVNDGNVRLEAVDGGVKVWYYIADTAVAFSVLYRLTEDGFTVTIPFADFLEHIQEGRVAPDRATVSYWGIRDISILPYFGAAGARDEGYMLIPDGSGALIAFNNQKSSYGAYSQDIYGRDPVLVLERNMKNARNVLMPVFGASFGDYGFFATAQKGAASASVNAMSAGTLTSYNNVYMAFRYRQSMSAVRSVANGYGESRSLASTVVVDNQYSENCYQLRYWLLDQDSADYVGMAQCYQDYLISEGMTKKEAASQASLYLTLYGGIEDTDYFLGIPYKTVRKLTTYTEAQEIIQNLKAGGIDHMAVRYCGWQKDGLEATVPTTVKYEGALGGKKDFRALEDSAEEAGIRFFPDVDFLNFYKSGKYSVNSDAIQAATHDTAWQYTYDLNLGSRQKENRWRMLTPNMSMEAFTKFMKNRDMLASRGISLGALGSTLYSDFTARSNRIHRDDALKLWSQMVRTASEAFDEVMVETGNIYAAMYADYVANVTSDSTGYNLTDETVPFYQIVLHGYVSYGTEPINLSPDPEKALLKALETGSNPGFSLIYGDAAELSDTRYNYLYNAGYESWKESVQEYYARVEPVLSAVAGQEITGHERLADNVYRTDFGAAGSVYVNYGKKDVMADNITIAARDYVYVEKERREQAWQENAN